MSKIAEALVEFFGSLFGLRSGIDRPLHNTGTIQQRRRRTRMSDEAHEQLMNEAAGFGAGDDISQEEINDLI